jgi:large subunit ribosomal protein L25
MESVTIEVSQKSGSGKEARLSGQIPMVYYAKNIEPKHFTVDYQNFRRAYRKAGKSTIINMVDEEKNEYQVLVHEIQYNPVSDEIMHVDLKAIKKDEKISTDVPIVFVGESAAVREQSGIFVSNKDSVYIECLPGDLPHEIEVDISPLVDFHSSLTVGDIKISDKITILDAPDISIATVMAPRAEEEPVTAEGTEGEETAGAEGEEKEAGAEGEEKKEERSAEGEKTE